MYIESLAVFFGHRPKIEDKVLKVFPNAEDIVDSNTKLS